MKRRTRNAQAARRTTANFLTALPLLVGVLGLTSLLSAIVPPDRLAALLPQDGWYGPVLGAMAGSIAAGHPTASYMMAGELLAAGVGLATVTAFLVSWVTVGIMQLPAEAAMLGLRFALWRNAVSFILAVAIGLFVATIQPAAG